MPPSFRPAPSALALCFGLALVGCAPEIGDSCDRSSDCSVNNDRVCDVAQPDGYCTVIGCDPDTCPDGALCVEWRPEPARSSGTFCMKSCNGDGACRKGDGYRCVREGDPELLQDGLPLAQVTDLEVDRNELGFATKGFCAASAAME